MPSKPHPTVCMKPKTVGLFFLRCGLLETVDKPRFHRPWNRATGSRFRTVHDGLFTVWRQKCTCKSVPAITWLLVSRRRGLPYQLPGTYQECRTHTIFLFSSSTRKRFYPQRSSGQAVVTGVVASPRYVPSIFIAHRVQHSHCSSIFIKCC